MTKAVLYDCSIRTEPSASSTGAIRTVFADAPLSSGEFKQVKGAIFIRISLFFCFCWWGLLCSEDVRSFFSPLHVCIYIDRSHAARKDLDSWLIWPLLLFNFFFFPFLSELWNLSLRWIESLYQNNYVLSLLLLLFFLLSYENNVPLVWEIFCGKVY